MQKEHLPPMSSATKDFIYFFLTMFSFHRVIAFVTYSVAFLGAVYWTFFVFTEFLEPTRVGNVQDYHYAVDVKLGVARLEVYVPSSQKSDNYQNVRVFLRR